MPQEAMGVKVAKQQGVTGMPSVVFDPAAFKAHYPEFAAVADPRWPHALTKSGPLFVTRTIARFKT